MNKTFLMVGVCSLLFTSFVSAEDVDKQPKELSNLRLKYESDVQDAIKPIRDRYIDDLKELLQSEMDKGDADAVVAVKKEIKKMETESHFSGKWTSPSNGVSVIQFKSQGRFVEDWNGSNHYEGHWEVDVDKGGVVVTRSDGWVLHFQINSQGHLIRDLGSTDYEPTDDQ